MLKKNNRFSGQKELMAVFRRGSKASGKGFYVRVADFRGSKGKVAVVVSKKISKKAVDRNRIRRRVYAALEPFISHLEEKAIVVTILNDAYLRQDFEAIRDDLTKTIEVAIKGRR